MADATIEDSTAPTEVQEEVPAQVEATEPVVEEMTEEQKAAQTAADEARVEEVELTGKCKWFHYQKGFGFIHEINDGGSEVFCHNSSITPFEGQTPILTAGLTVKFKFKIDKDGRSRADCVTSVDGGPVRTHNTRKHDKMAARLDTDGDIRLGWVKWFNPEKGYGFITPENSEEAELFVHQEAVTFSRGVVGLTKGQDIEYKVQKEVKDDGKEQFRAQSVTGPGGQPVAGQQQMQQMPMPMGGRSMTLLGKRPANGALLPRDGHQVSLLTMQQGGVKRIQMGQQGMQQGMQQRQHMGGQMGMGGGMGGMMMGGQQQQQQYTGGQQQQQQYGSNPYQKYL